MGQEVPKIVNAKEDGSARLRDYVFVDLVKERRRLKSRFSVRSFNDSKHGILTVALTLQNISLRILISVAANYE